MQWAELQLKVKNLKPSKQPLRRQVLVLFQLLETLRLTLSCCSVSFSNLQWSKKKLACAHYDSVSEVQRHQGEIFGRCARTPLTWTTRAHARTHTYCYIHLLVYLIAYLCKTSSIFQCVIIFFSHHSVCKKKKKKEKSEKKVNSLHKL